MTQIKEGFLDNFLFKFDSHSCNFAEDIEHIAPGKKPITRFKIQAEQQCPITFAYAAKDGLVRIAPNGAIEERNILGILISLTKKSTKELSKFLKDNGFLFPVSTDSYEEIDKETLNALIDRLRMTVELMTAVSEIRKNYPQICNLAISLLFAESINYKTTKMDSPYCSCHYTYLDLLENAPTQKSFKREKEAFNGETYEISDSIYGSYLLDINDYNDIIGGYSSVQDWPQRIYQNLASMFVNYEANDMTKKISDFLFHYLYDMHGDSSSGFSEEMKVALLDIARYIIGEEINANLTGIHPIYNTQTMAPSWKVDSLLCAAYFSIFYLKPELELYRQCENPRCRCYFLVKTTSTKKKFCCQECCNRVTQDRHRKKQREKLENISI